MATDIGICNLALASLGEEPIIALSDPNQRARLCNRFYEIVKDNYLTEHPWSFCAKIDALVEETTDVDGYDWAPYKFEYPSDCLKARAVVDGDTHYSYPFVIRDIVIASVDTKLIFTSLQDAFLEYTVDLDESYFSSPFEIALSKKLAFEMAWGLTKDRQVQQQAYDQYLLADASAKQKDSSEELPSPHPLTWEESRRGAITGYPYRYNGLRY